MKKIKRFFAFLLENLTTLIAAFTGVCLFFSYKERDPQELLGYIIAILTLIAGSMLIETASKMSSINKRVKNIDLKLTDSNIFMYCQSSSFWNDALHSAKSLFITGGSLFHVITEKTGDFELLLKNGCNIEVVVVKPYSDASKLLHNNVVMEINDPDKFSDNIVQTLDFLFKYNAKYPKQLTIRLNDNVPAFGIFAIYQNSKNAEPQKIQINLFSEKVPYDKRLAITLDESMEKNHLAYNYFCEQIKLLKKRSPECTIADLKRSNE